MMMISFLLLFAAFKYRVACNMIAVDVNVRNYIDLYATRYFLLWTI